MTRIQATRSILAAAVLGVLTPAFAQSPASMTKPLCSAITSPTAAKVPGTDCIADGGAMDTNANSSMNQGVSSGSMTPSIPNSLSTPSATSATGALIGATDGSSSPLTGNTLSVNPDVAVDANVGIGNTDANSKSSMGQGTTSEQASGSATAAPKAGAKASTSSTTTTR